MNAAGRFHRLPVFAKLQCSIHPLEDQPSKARITFTSKQVPAFCVEVTVVKEEYAVVVETVKGRWGLPPSEDNPDFPLEQFQFEASVREFGDDIYHLRVDDHNYLDFWLECTFHLT